MATKNKITDPHKAQAAIAYLIAQGWGIDLAKMNKEIPGGLQSQDWIDIANGCLDFVMKKIEDGKVIPIMLFRKQ